MSIDPAGVAALLHTPAAMVHGRFDSGTRHCGPVRSDEVTERTMNLEDKILLPYKSSPSAMIHRFSDGGMETPDCGQHIDGEWSSFFAEEPHTPEELAEKYSHLRFCTKCFQNTWKLDRIRRENQ